jgi:hypothetical protein
VLSSPIIDLAIGLTFVFAVTAALASFVTELISRLIGLRGAYLLSGLRELVDGGEEANLGNAKSDYDKMQKIMLTAAAPTTEPPDKDPPSSMTSALLGGPILSNQGIAGSFYTRNITLAQSTGTGRLPKMTPGPEPAPGPQPAPDAQAAPGPQPAPDGQAVPGPQAAPGPKPARGPQFAKLWRQLRSLPSYISSKSFADAVIDLIVPDATGQTTMDVIQRQVNAMPDSPLKPQLQALVKEASGDVSRFRTSVEKWYDDHMARVSGWYKRHVAKITLAAGAVIVILLNLNALTIGRTLYTENAVSSAVSAVAAKAVPASCSSSSTSQECLADLEEQLSAAASAGLPVGWGTVRACREHLIPCNWLDQRGIFSPYGSSGWQLVLLLVGFLIMIISLVPGAQFWFGLLTRLNTLRTTGPPPALAPSNAVNLTIVPSAVTSSPGGAAAPPTAPLEQQPPPEAG